MAKFASALAVRMGKPMLLSLISVLKLLFSFSPGCNSEIQEAKKVLFNYDSAKFRPM